jgi:hypothetical protein
MRLYCQRQDQFLLVDVEESEAKQRKDELTQDGWVIEDAILV